MNLDDVTASCVGRVSLELGWNFLELSRTFWNFYASQHGLIFFSPNGFFFKREKDRKF